ncbi:unannotated protein [freshwater metagenome]|uniref:Unannotated protein n=1 Tax=freshwater metagenome TaxID=449393 RepID=A0A6J7L7D3_9ZZZZ
MRVWLFSTTRDRPCFSEESRDSSPVVTRPMMMAMATTPRRVIATPMVRKCVPSSPLNVPGSSDLTNESQKPSRKEIFSSAGPHENRV